jgi:hypothetical protein
VNTLDVGIDLLDSLEGDLALRSLEGIDLESM